MDAYEFRQPGGNTFYVAWLNPTTMGFDLDGNGTPKSKKRRQSVCLERPPTFAISMVRAGSVSSDGYVKVLIGGQPKELSKSSNDKSGDYASD